MAFRRGGVGCCRGRLLVQIGSRSLAARYMAVIRGAVRAWSLQLGQASPAQPDYDHVAQNIFLTLRNPLALPANFQGADGFLNVLPHFNPIFRWCKFCHKTLFFFFRSHKFRERL